MLSWKYTLLKARRDTCNFFIWLWWNWRLLVCLDLVPSLIETDEIYSIHQRLFYLFATLLMSGKATVSIIVISSVTCSEIIIINRTHRLTMVLQCNELVDIVPSPSFTNLLVMFVFLDVHVLMWPDDLSRSCCLIISRRVRPPIILLWKSFHDIPFRWDWCYSLSLNNVWSLCYKCRQLRLVSTFLKFTSYQIASRLLIA